MNDVKLSSVDLAAKQRSAASSTQPDASEKVQSKKEGGAVTKASTQNAIADFEARELEKNAGKKRAKVEEAVTRLNDYVQTVQRDLQFNLDETSGKTIITVVDSKTSEVIRQIPDDVALRLARELQQDEPLRLFNAKV